MTDSFSLFCRGDHSRARLSGLGLFYALKIKPENWGWVRNYRGIGSLLFFMAWSRASLLKHREE